MPTDVSQSHDGENQKSDQVSTRRDSSSNKGHIHDFATHPYQLHEQQQRKDTEGRGDSYGYSYRNNRDTAIENRLRHPFSTQLDTIQKMLEAPSTSKAGEKRPADIIAEVANKLKQRGTEDPIRDSRLLGGTREDAEAYLQQIDEGTENAQLGDARKEMNKFHSKRNTYQRRERNGTYQDHLGRTPADKAAAEEPVGYDIYKEYHRRYKLPSH